MADETKMYTHMENVLQQINKNFVTLPESMKKQYNIYQEVVKTVIDKMKETNTLFSVLYRELFYGGSYYDGLKISKPEEYDLDLLLKLPEYATPNMTPSHLPGFVKVRFERLEQFQQQPEYKSYYTELPKILDDKNYLDADKVKTWMESVINKTLNKFAKSGDQKTFTCENMDAENNTFFIKLVKGGPAFTLQIVNPTMKIDVDLVPCFVFEKWPSHCDIEPNPCPIHKTFFIVPKKPHSTPKDGFVNHCWRMSFQIQERDLIKGKEFLKPALKLLKKLRDTLDHVCVSSYFLKTIFLFEVKKRSDNFWGSNLSTTFMEMLKVYHSYLEKKCIPYYWNENHNMIGHIKQSQLENVANKVKNIIKEIDRTSADPFIVAKYLLNKEELQILKDSVSSNTKTGESSNGKMASTTSRNGNVSLEAHQYISRNIVPSSLCIEDQLLTLNNKLDKIMLFQQMLTTKMDDLVNRVKCIELHTNSSNEVMSISNDLSQ